MALKKLVQSFDDEQGLPGETFEATVALLSALLGESAAQVFNRYIDATEGRFYLKEGTAEACWAEICWQDICKAAN